MCSEDTVGVQETYSIAANCYLTIKLNCRMLRCAFSSNSVE